ncbi:MAG TPA: SHOCT domain-containing protein [Actinomycetes bacterium]|nr:SHOCT domain-containing protein [Actinomycetes bacterium]
MDLGDFLWTLVVIFFMVVYFMILFSVIGDLFRSKDLNGFSKTIWIFALLFLPLISLLVYVIARGDGMAERQIEAVGRAQEQQMAMAKQIVATDSSSAADQIHKAKELLDSGAISQAEYDAIKAKALA